MSFVYYKLFNFIFNLNKKFLYLIILFISLSSCSSKLNLQIVIPPIHKIEKIEFIEVGDFTLVEGFIPPPKLSDSESRQIFSSNDKLIEPSITTFISKKNDDSKIIDLLSANLIHQLSQNSPYNILTKKDFESGFSGKIPELDKVAVLNGKIKFYEKRIESNENLSYFTNVKNRGVSLQETILARTISMGIENSGTGFNISTPYVEQIVAIEVEFSLFKKNNLRNIIPKQTIFWYFAKKWGGNPKSSHLPLKTKKTILEKFHRDERLSNPILSRIDQAGMYFLDPTEYFARGYNLKNTSLIPKSSLEIKIDISRQVAKQYVKLISPLNSTSEIILEDGDKIAKTLIIGNAYLDAISYLLGLENRNAKDEYNLGLAYEAIGEIKQANIYYKSALDEDPEKDIYLKAVTRTKK